MKESLYKFKKEIEFKQKNSNKWYNEKLKQMKESRDDIYKRAKQTDKRELWAQYNKLRNKYSKMIKKASNNYTKMSIKECEGDSKAMWKKLKELISEKQSEVEKIEISGNILSNEKQVAETLNNYFIDSIKELNSNIKKWHHQ